MDFNEKLKLTKDIVKEAANKTVEFAKNIDIDDAKKKVVEIGNKTASVIKEIDVNEIKDKTYDYIKDTADVIKNKTKLDQELMDATEEYNAEYISMNDFGTKLLIDRIRSQDAIVNIETLINSIANHPKQFDTDIMVIKEKRQEFQGVCDFAKKELDLAKQSAARSAGGAAAGVAVASMMPTAALWVATTFGTASTGTAIASLSGAAATNAALAWLGGGAITAGGGGMAAGNAFLAMAGPIGWSIAGATLLTSIVLFTKGKVDNLKAERDEIAKVKMNTTHVKEIGIKIKNMLDKTISLRTNLVEQFTKCMPTFDKDYEKLDNNTQMSLGALVNNTKSLAISLSENVSE